MADADYFYVVHCMPRGAAHELDVAVVLMDEQQDWMPIQDMPTNERRLVIVESVTGELNHGFATHSA